jgi:hypothetical protein
MNYFVKLITHTSLLHSDQNLDFMSIIQVHSPTFQTLQNLHPFFVVFQEPQYQMLILDTVHPPP